MKISNRTRVKVLAKTSRVSTEGRTFYQIAVMSGGEAGNISCSQEVHDMVEEMKDYDLETVYNSDYKSFNAVHVLSPVNAPAK